MKSFEEKVRAMSAKEIILAMVEGLKHPAVNVDMSEIGDVYNGVCYGCAATNAICRISNTVFTPDSIESLNKRAKAIKADKRFLDAFENAIDALRDGNVKRYNYYAGEYDFARIANPEIIHLPELETCDYLDNLAPYIALADSQPVPQPVQPQEEKR